MRRLVIILDPAHGEDVKGKQSPDGTHREYIWSREVCKLLSEALQKNNFRVEFTNTTEKEIGLSKRKEIANSINTNDCEKKFLISLHNNAAGDGKSWANARGFEIYTSRGQTVSDKFADIIMENLKKDFPAECGYKVRKDLSDGDMDKEASFTVLLGSSYYAVLLEWLFQDNQEDLKLLNSNDVNLALVNSLTKSLIYIDNNLDSLTT